MQAMKIAVMISGGGSNLQAIIDAVGRRELSVEIACVISNRMNAYGLERAELAGISTYYIGKGNHPDRTNREEVLLEVLKAHSVDLIVLAGYLDILSEKVIRAYDHKIINIHPSLIPKYCGKGFYGMHVHEAVLKSGDAQTGVTVHFVDQGVDTGEIIAQRTLDVLPGDTPESLGKRVLEVEHALLVSTLEKIVTEFGGK
jgi:phosphoribosylglycinamide formyltransferase-1